MTAEEASVCAGVDVGGTFTDVVVWAPDQHPRAVKVPTTPGNQAEGVERGIHEGFTLGPDADRTRLHTATNAVLERKTARAAFVTTDGFADVLESARQDRPSLYDLAVTRPPPLVPCDRVVSVKSGWDLTGNR